MQKELVIKLIWLLKKLDCADLTLKTEMQRISSVVVKNATIRVINI